MVALDANGKNVPVRVAYYRVGVELAKSVRKATDPADAVDQHGNAALSVLGPGIFAIGYTIGTGSVTSMAKAGADYGLGLLWVLALSCLFSGVLMDAYGRVAAVTGKTSLSAMRDHLPSGKVFAWLVFVGVVMGQYTCLGGILSLSSGAIAANVGLGLALAFSLVIAYSGTKALLEVIHG